MSAIWMQTLSGQAIDLLEPSAAAFRLSDIATQLSRAPRFAGATKSQWSVAAHSRLVESLLPVGASARLHLRALLHDAHEFIIGDIPTPVQLAIASFSGGDPLSHLKARIQGKIDIAAGLALHELGIRIGEDLEIKRVDAIALAVERKSLLVESLRDWGIAFPDISRIAHGCISQGPESEARAFVFRFRRLVRDAGVTPLAGFDDAPQGSAETHTRDEA